MAEMTEDKGSAPRGVPRTDFNVLDIAAGERIRLSDGTTAEVVSNPRDGMWVMVRFLESPSDPSQNDTEGLAFAEDIVEVFEARGPGDAVPEDG